MAMFTKNKDEESEDAVAVEDGNAPEAEAEDAPVDEAEAVTDGAEVAETDSEADAASGESAAPAESEAAAEADLEDDDDDDEEEDDGPVGGDELDLDLMDIFESEQNESTSTAGIYSEFLENLTMEEVLDQANMLLDEIRAKLGR